VLQSALLLFTWVGGYLRVPGASTAYHRSEPKQVHNDAVGTLTTDHHLAAAKSAQRDSTQELPC